MAARWACRCTMRFKGKRVGLLLVDRAMQTHLSTRCSRPICSSTRAEAGVALNLLMQQGYDYSYFWIYRFIEDHMR